jgi:anti-sigma regulatory factor (Ser/Thr protein kinase)
LAFELTIDAAPQIATPNEAIRQCVEFLESHRLSTKSLQTIRLAISEALANALEHGIMRLPSALKEYLFTSKADWLNDRMQDFDQGQVSLKIQLMPDESTENGIKAVSVEVTDTGPGFDWKAYLENHAMPSPDKIYGRGLALIKLFASHLSFNDVGNSIQFIIPASSKQRRTVSR